jgi:hypothetical protein
MLMTTTVVATSALLVPLPPPRATWIDDGVVLSCCVDGCTDEDRKKRI